MPIHIEGSKTGLELPGIVDEVITLTEIQPTEGKAYRAFVCTTINPYGYPAKDRSGRLGTIEEPHLGRLMTKIRNGKPTTNARALTFDMPSEADAVPTPTQTQGA